MNKFQTSKGDFLSVLLPDDAVLIGRMCNNFWSYFSKSKGHGKFPLVGKHSIVNFLSEITEEPAKEIVEEGILIWEGLKYHNYNKPKGDFSKYYTLNTALESFNSLMQSIECYNVNPYGKEPLHPIQDKIMEEGIHGIYKEKLNKWQKAQDNTGNWLILKKEN